MDRPDDPLREKAALRARLAHLSRTSLRIAEDLNMSAMLQGVVDAARLLSGASLVSIRIMDGSGQVQDLVSSNMDDAELP